MPKYNCKKENYAIILPVACTVDIGAPRDENQGYASACISLPCRQCRSCISPPCRRGINLEQIEKIDTEKLFSELLAA